MTTPLVSITAGWTGRLGPFTLRIDGVPLVLTGMTVAIILTRWNTFVPFTAGGSVVVASDQVGSPGQVSYDPVSTDFSWTSGVVEQQNYTLHWKVTDGSGKIVYFPNGAPSIIAVFKA